MKRKVLKASLLRDLFALVVACIILLNFTGMVGHHHAELSKSSTLQRHLDASTRLSVVEQTPLAIRKRSLGLLDFDFISSHLLREAPWAESHGADHHLFLGAGLLYYSLAYTFQCQTIVVLGSGGGFVPRMLRQAQRDLERTRSLKGGQRSSAHSPFQVILVDAHVPWDEWGVNFYAENEQTTMRRDFADIRYIFNTTDEAYEMIKSEGILIDYLHLDADYSFDQSYKDFTNYASLLSPKGIVSFHDTCHSDKDNCDSSVWKTLREIQLHGNDSYELQFLDAHYLYQGISIAIPKNAPVIETPKGARWNFCHHNVESVLKPINDFDRNGQIPSFGAFYDCEGNFDVTLLGKPCPPGFRRSLRQKERCLKCIPGMKGQNCTEFRYKEKREVHLPHETHKDMLQRHRLVAAWLAEYNVQHLFEMSAIPVSKSLYHPILSAVAADPRIKQPLWTDEGETPIIRWLPVRAKDLLLDGDYASTVELDQTDAAVCIDCRRHFQESTDLLRLLDEFPRLRILVLESHVESEILTNVTHTLPSDQWTKEAELVLGSPDLERSYPSQHEVIRQMLLFVKKEHTFSVK